MNVTLLSFTPIPVDVIEIAASTCYHSEPTEDGRIMRACYRNRHHSVLEHVNFTFKIEGVSRAMMAQLTRHRLASFSVESQRYCEMSNANFVIPDTVTAKPEAMSAFFQALSQCGAAYGKMLELGIPAEDARFIIPNACATNITMTMNLREFIHLCNERLCARAQWEIRRAVKLMVDEVNRATDNVFAEFLVPKCEADKNHPFCTESKKDSCGMHPRLAEFYPKEEEK